jgi:SpoVK/Ycf46/Vps4 family AAA+-type ATPase
MMNETPPITEPDRWKRANREHLEAALARLRLLLHRRALWLRKQWAHDASQDYMAWRISQAQADWLLGGEDRPAEAAFYAGDAEAIALGESLASVEARIAEASLALQQAGAPAALDVLARLFGLSRFECNVFLLALAPELDASFERLYAYVQDDLTRRHATPQLALTLLASSEEAPAARDCLLPAATLRRFRLLALEDTAPPSAFANRPLRVDERMLNFALGVNRPDERLASILEEAPAALIASTDQALVERVVGWAQSAAGRLISRSVNLMGGADASPLHLARAVCDAMGIALFQVNAASLPAAQAERRELLALIEREAVLLQMALYFDLDAVRAEERRELVHDIDRLRAFAIIASAVRWGGERETLVLPVPRPNATQQAELWQQALTAVGGESEVELGALVEQFDLGPAHIGRAVTAARELAALRADTAPTIDDLWRACEQEAAPKLDELAQRIIPCYGWDDIVLPTEPFRQLQEIAAQVAHRTHVYRNWGFGAKLNRGRGISALFAGASGTGKTMAAEVLARHLRLDLYRIDLAGVVSKYIGETERNLRSIFAAAERGGVILFFDECDALFGKRSEVKDSHDRYANIEVNYLLQRMEDFRGLAILATNRRSALDFAFVRRLRFIIDFPFPDAAHRQRIWESVFPPQADVQGLDFARLACFEIPGGHIRNIALAAAFLAAHEGAPIGMLHLMRAARREYTKMDRIVQEADFGPYYAAVTP